MRAHARTHREQTIKESHVHVQSVSQLPRLPASTRAFSLMFGPCLHVQLHLARRLSFGVMPEITLQLPSLMPADKLGISITNDFHVHKTNPGSIGEQAGFLAGDLLVSIDELRITKGMDKLTVASTMRGDPSKVQAPKSIVVMRETAEDEDEDKDEGLVPLTVPSMPVGVRMGLSVAKGNVVRSVDPGSYAELAGFRTSDVVVSIGGVPMAGVAMLEVATRIRGDRTATTHPCKVLVRRSAANSAAVAAAAQLKVPAEAPAEAAAELAAEAARAAEAPIWLIGAALEKAPVVQSQGIVGVSSGGVNVNGQFIGAVPPPSAVAAFATSVAELAQSYAELKRELAAAVASENYAVAAELQKTIHAAESRLDVVGQSGGAPRHASTGSSTRPRAPALNMPIAAMDRGEVHCTEGGEAGDSALESALWRRAPAKTALDAQLSNGESKATQNPDRISSLEAGDQAQLRRWQESDSEDWKPRRDTRVDLEMDGPLLALAASARASAASTSLASVQIHMTKMGGDGDLGGGDVDLGGGDGDLGGRNGPAAPSLGWTALVAQAHTQALQAANSTHAPSQTLETQLLIALLGRGEILPPDLTSLEQAFEQARQKGLLSGLKVVLSPDADKQPRASVHTTLSPSPGRRTSGTAGATDDLD